MGRDWLTYFQLDWPKLLGETPVFIIVVENELPEVFKNELECYSKGNAHLLVDASTKPKFLRVAQCLMLYSKGRQGTF